MITLTNILFVLMLLLNIASIIKCFDTNNKLGLYGFINSFIAVIGWMTMFNFAVFRG